MCYLFPELIRYSVYSSALLYNDILYIWPYQLSRDEITIDGSMYLISHRLVLKRDELKLRNKISQ